MMYNSQIQRLHSFHRLPAQAVEACARLSEGASPTRQPLQPEAIGAVMEVTKWLKPSISVSRIGDSASVQAATRVNAEQALYGAFEVKHIFYTTLYFLHSSFFVRLGIPFLRPDPHVLRPTRTGPVKVGRRSALAARSVVSRPRLDRARARRPRWLWSGR